MINVSSRWVEGFQTQAGGGKENENFAHTSAALIGSSSGTEAGLLIGEKSPWAQINILI